MKITMIVNTRDYIRMSKQESNLFIDSQIASQKAVMTPYQRA